MQSTSSRPGACHLATVGLGQHQPDPLSCTLLEALALSIREKDQAAPPPRPVLRTQPLSAGICLLALHFQAIRNIAAFSAAAAGRRRAANSNLSQPGQPHIRRASAPPACTRLQFQRRGPQLVLKHTTRRTSTDPHVHQTACALALWQTQPAPLSAASRRGWYPPSPTAAADPRARDLLLGNALSSPTAVTQHLPLAAHPALALTPQPGCTHGHTTRRWQIAPAERSR
jgi:hypothetical protein